MEDTPMLVHTDESHSPVPPLARILANVDKQLKGLKDGWSQRLNDDPASFGKVELEVHQTMQQAADQIVAGLLAQVGQQSSLEDASKKSR
jgi:hypothetical protein